MSGFIAWILLGLIAGGLAKLLMPGDQKGGCLLTTLLGIIGAVIGGWLGRFATFLPTEPVGTWLPSLGSIVTATVGALVLLLIFRLVSK
ncbi:GlsB/YeaQ/YmgE family stress response membrane protein [Luteolibacter ambystomatis]|uniref:GlsB/YeaQ/YmgE family stress response membrane protein n=1 Tax=Luteolibacter ambystomatis TaxID=2824561 RepID=A0A975G862_9BACT|nr:GlsB/YeaQ/YmgE family stress response membrane protein [Luteolibacter ambystomatis]QUE50080.1 GlsB/YeaQ/YmgE family stress response membrane protein [Luteolibacter ambystomatis]